MHSSKEELFYKVVEKQCGIKRNEDDPTQIGGLNIFWLLGLGENETDVAKIEEACERRIGDCSNLEHADLEKANEWKQAITEFMMDKSKGPAYLQTYRNELYQKRFEKLFEEAKDLSLSGAPQNVAENFLRKKAEKFGFHKSDINNAVSELVNRFKRINTL